jgi:signal transduction histidine kinase
MPTVERSVLRCLLLAPLTDGFEQVRRTVELAAKESRVRLVSFEQTMPPGLPGVVLPEILRADLVIAVVSHASANVFYEVGLAHAAGKRVIFLVDEEAGTPFFPTRFAVNLTYTVSAVSLARLQKGLRKFFNDFRRDPRRFPALPTLAPRQQLLPVVDLDRLDPREFENLCFELLTQMGFRQVEWGKELKEIDVVATLPKKDPDGFQYDELWFVSMGLHAPVEMLLEMGGHDPEFLLHRLFHPSIRERFKASFRPDTPITLLVILPHEHPHSEMLKHELRRMEQRSLERRSVYALRVRFWDRQQLTSLIQQYPQISYKYFSEEGRSQSKYRKSPEELYLENVELTKRLQAEQDKRVKAERDAVWKDVAFKATHKLGNPIFALETDLQGLTRRLQNGSQPDQAFLVAAEMAGSIEKAKAIIEQFKSLIRAQEITLRPVDLVPLLTVAARIAKENGVEIQIETPDTHLQALADPARMTECFDELFANALHWLNKPQKRIVVTVDIAKKKALPPGVDDSRKYIRVRFEDNGCGVTLDKKDDIFAPFVTTYAHGTGLGLSVVQRVLEGHGGAVREVGKPGEGAVFELFIPQATSKNGTS